jgi:hypothetical protein
MVPVVPRLRWPWLIAMLLLAACDATPATTAPAPPVFDADTLEPTVMLTLDDVQGCWWMDCKQPHAEFCLSGERVYGDFEHEGTATVVANRLMVAFPGGTTLNEHIELASRDRLVLDGSAGRIAYRTCP